MSPSDESIATTCTSLAAAAAEGTTAGTRGAACSGSNRAVGVHKKDPSGDHPKRRKKLYSVQSHHIVQARIQQNRLAQHVSIYTYVGTVSSINKRCEVLAAVFFSTSMPPALDPVILADAAMSTCVPVFTQQSSHANVQHVTAAMQARHGRGYLSSSRPVTSIHCTLHQHLVESTHFHTRSTTGAQCAHKL